MTRTANGHSFKTREKQRQADFFNAEFPGRARYKDSDVRLDPDQKCFNLAPAIRKSALRYMDDKKITWHTHANHGLSSQVCCLNFLMPLAECPSLLSKLVGTALDIAPPEMLPVEPGPESRPWFVGFEWVGRQDYLGEAPPPSKRPRGANATSADAVLRFRHAGQIETLLIEWKYTESYGAPLAAGNGNASNNTRVERYQQLAFDPDGPVRNDLGLSLENFFYEPFYQLLRQQMLAFQMQKAGEEGTARVRVLHISPSENTAFKKVTAPVLRRFGASACEVFRSLLVEPENFVSRSTEELFEPLLSDGVPEWANYIRSRYGFACPQMG